MSRKNGAIPREGAYVVDASGCSLMPGLVDAHSHLSIPMVKYITQMDDMAPEELLAATLYHARLMLDAAFTGCIGAGSPRS